MFATITPILGLMALVSPQNFAPRDTTPGHTLRPALLRRQVAQEVIDPATLAALIPRRPVLGGAWRVGGPRDVGYVAPGVVAIDYEDGHVAGRLVVRIFDAGDARTWQVVEDRER